MRLSRPGLSCETLLGVFGPTIARQPLLAHGRLTRLFVRSAFGWALVGAAILCHEAAQPMVELPIGSAFLLTSAARHAFGLGLVSLMLYGVAARAIPGFLGRRL